MAKLTEAQFEQQYADATGQTLKQANEEINTFKRVLNSIAVAGNDVGFSGTGVFQVKTLAARSGSSPITGSWSVPERKTLKFKASDVLREAMNA